MDGYAGNYRQGDDTMKTDKTHHDLSRRDFLRWSGTLAAGLAAAPLMAGVHQERTRKVRIGVVGGNFGASPGIIAHQSALQGGKQLRIPHCDPR
jgi:hypothetical protein